MILTEEQRGALARAIDYINETDLPVGELDGFDREVLRSMVTTAINYGPDVMKMIELLAAGEHEQWADWAQSILDSEPGLSDGRKAAWPEMIATPYENLSEELKDKDRREVYLRSQAALDYIQQQSAEIERLRASLIDLHAEYINTLEKNPECSAWDLDEQSDADQRRLRKNAAHAISIVEPPIYLQADQQATLIKSLKKEIRRLKHESKVEQEFTNSYIKRLHDAEARIKELGSSLDEAEALTKKNAELMNGYLGRIKVLEKNCIYDPEDGKIFVPDGHPEIERLRARVVALEDALVEERARVITSHPLTHVIDEDRTEASMQLQAEGKIGPDAALKKQWDDVLGTKPRSWQITEERVEALKQAAHTCHEVTAFDIAKVLRAMLEEAERE